uniref:ATP synthase F0 subunit a n=1 Tax=Hypnea pseudomusciformis TaxID=1545697 RepID=UPI0023F21D92|nr:ATP synthase F0 subunit a [Hypnea pseudomusciformis]WCH57770.1 ATP synthase F0 subunit a [Hypnea pseudomusciformis]WDY85194.1 ATP synthase F0 subunit a [Hypnea pseudomusciformis]
MSNIITSPLEQFEIVALIPLNIGGINFSLTNSSLFLIIAFFLIIFWTNLSFYNLNLIPNNWQLIKESLYKVTSSIVEDNIGRKGEYYLPFIFTLHLMLLYSNLIGMVPYSFTVTSHIVFTFSLALAIFIGINIIGVQTHGFKFFALFLPRGVPLAIVPLLVSIEFLSYIVKVFTLSIRLFANMTSGHTLLKIIAGFAWTMLSAGGLLAVFHIIPLGLLLALIGLELAIAGLQAYVFTLLTCIYLNDVLDMH